MIAKVVLNSVRGLGVELVEKGRQADDLAEDVLRGDLLLGGVLEERAQLGSISILRRSEGMSMMYTVSWDRLRLVDST